MAKVVGDVGGLERRADGGDGFDGCDVSGGFEDRRAAQRVADQKGGRVPHSGEVVGGSMQVADVAGEGRVAEFTA